VRLKDWFIEHSKKKGRLCLSLCLSARAKSVVYDTSKCGSTGEGEKEKEKKKKNSPVSVKRLKKKMRNKFPHLD